MRKPSFPSARKIYKVQMYGINRYRAGTARIYACGAGRLRGRRSKKPIGFRQWVVHLGILKRRECDGTAYEWADNGREVFIDTLYASAFSPEMDCCFYKADFYGNENPSGSSFIPDKAVSIIIQTAASNPDTVRKELLLHALRYVYDEKEALEMYANCTCFQKIQEKHHHKCIDADTGIVTTSKSFDTDIFS